MFSHSEPTSMPALVRLLLLSTKRSRMTDAWTTLMQSLLNWREGFTQISPDEPFVRTQSVLLGFPFRVFDRSPPATWVPPCNNEQSGGTANATDTPLPPAAAPNRHTLAMVSHPTRVVKARIAPPKGTVAAMQRDLTRQAAR